MSQPLLLLLYYYNILIIMANFSSPMRQSYDLYYQSCTLYICCNAYTFLHVILPEKRPLSRHFVDYDYDNVNRYYL